MKKINSIIIEGIVRSKSNENENFIIFTLENDGNLFAVRAFNNYKTHSVLCNLNEGDTARIVGRLDNYNNLICIFADYIEKY